MHTGLLNRGQKVCKGGVRRRSVVGSQGGVRFGRHEGRKGPAGTVLDPGPIPYARIDLYGDPDLEHALREEGIDPQATTYRLIEIPLSSIVGIASMPWGRMGTAYVDALQAGQQFPPIVVFRDQHGWQLLDGVNRTHAHWVLGTARIRAYDLLTS
jgi:hypothetical protein